MCVCACVRVCVCMCVCVCVSIYRLLMAYTYAIHERRMSFISFRCLQSILGSNCFSTIIIGSEKTSGHPHNYKKL